MKGKKIKSTLMIFLGFMIILSGCGGGTGGFSGDTITGQLVAPDGSTPVPDATVYVPGGSNASVFVPSSNTNAITGGCESPPEPYIVYTCTGADGSFTLDVSNLSGTITIKFKKGSFKKTIVVNFDSFTGRLGKVSLPADPAKGGPKIAVVTGDYDMMENLLAKLGFGDITSWGYLQYGTEKFDLYDGNYSLDPQYRDFPDIFLDTDGDSIIDIYNYDIVFINCGNAYENNILTDPTKINILRDYVQQGGKLYVTDLSYDFVEQVFPEFIDFYGSDSTAESTPETMDAAEVGDSDITTNAEILDTTLKEWLKVVSCVDAFGNPINCIDPATERVHIEGFLSGWAVINGAHPGKSAEVTTWVRGDVSWNMGITGTKPLTITFTFGNGKVLYTSYHTEAGFSIGSGLLPQERILQFLVFF